MKRILLTGSNGFVGRNITEKFSGRYNIIPVRSSKHDLRIQSVAERLIKDVKPDIIIHAAGSVGGIGANKSNPGKFMYDNLVMGTNIIHASNETGIEKFILLSTVCSYPKFTAVPFKEEDLWSGYPEETNAPYGIAKKTLMKLLEAYRQQYGLNGITLIPVNMYGPHDHFDLESGHVIPALIRKLHEAKERNYPSIEVWGTGAASREFLFAPDCADAIELAMLHYNSSEPVNVGTGCEISIKDLVSKIKSVVGFTGEIIYDTTKPNGQPRRCLDTHRAKEGFGFEAVTSFDVGIETTYSWYKESI